MGESSESSESSFTQHDDWEPSTWFREAARTCIKRVGRPDPTDPEPFVVVTGLNGPLPDPGSDADHQCDRCGVRVPPHLTLVTFVARYRISTAGSEVQIGVGLCRSCAKREGLPK